MATIYVDYNIISVAGRVPCNTESAACRKTLLSLAGAGHKFALSAWHAYELAKSKRDDHVASCCDLIDELQPHWVSNNRFVISHELERFIAKSKDNLSSYAFNNLISQMWATYSHETIIVGETFKNTVRLLRETPGCIEEIEAAANETPEAIQIGRRAIMEGRLATHQRIIDGEYFNSVLLRARHVDIDYLVTNIDAVLESCPSVAVEEHMTQLRVRDGFRPEPSDGPDLQHVIVPLAYCDYFVSNDKTLIALCEIIARKIGLRCIVSRTLPPI